MSLTKKAALTNYLGSLRVMVELLLIKIPQLINCNEFFSTVGPKLANAIPVLDNSVTIHGFLGQQQQQQQQ